LYKHYAEAGRGVEQRLGTAIGNSVFPIFYFIFTVQYNTMKKILFSLAATLFLAPAFTQSINKITIADNGNVEKIAFEVETNVILNITTDGNIKDWGYDLFMSRGGENYMDRLDPYVGRVEYYSANDNEAFRGKIKSIGKTTISWYASYEGDAFKGKIKSIGSSAIQYYDNYEDKAYSGKIKSIGGNNLTWYASYNNEAYRGKLMSLGSTQFTYYSNTDDKAYQGKLKSLGGMPFTYYSSFDRQEYRGRMKTGTQIQFVNAVKYFVRN
jgi:hypothetical protein